MGFTAAVQLGAVASSRPGPRPGLVGCGPGESRGGARAPRIRIPLRPVWMAMSGTTGVGTSGSAGACWNPRNGNAGVACVLLFCAGGGCNCSTPKPRAPRQLQTPTAVLSSHGFAGMLFDVKALYRHSYMLCLQITAIGTWFNSGSF